MTKALEVKHQVEAHYKHGFNRADLATHLRQDRIDQGVPAVRMHDGYDAPYTEYYPVILYYSDGSMLVVSHRLVAATQET